jgi:hypothetical protein
MILAVRFATRCEISFGTIGSALAGLFSDFAARLEPMRPRQSSPQGHDYSALPQFFQLISPVNHHIDPLGPIFSAGVSLSYRVGLDMRKLRFDSVGNSYCCIPWVATSRKLTNHLTVEIISFGTIGSMPPSTFCFSAAGSANLKPLGLAATSIEHQLSSCRDSPPIAASYDAAREDAPSDCRCAHSDPAPHFECGVDARERIGEGRD